MIRLFQNEECLSEILKVVSEYISKKRAASVDSLHAYLYRTMKKMMVSQDTAEFESSDIWQRIKYDLQGSEVKGKPMSYDTEDFGILSQKKIIGILKDVFGAEPPRHTGTTKKLIFNKNKFDRLDSVYNLELEVRVGRGTEKNDVGLDKHIPSLTANTAASTNTKGVVYNGTVAITSFPFNTSYKDSMRQLTLIVQWQSGAINRHRTNVTYIAKDGIQNYVY